MSASPALRRCIGLLLCCGALSCDREAAFEPRSARSDTPDRDVVATVTQILSPDSAYRATTRLITLASIPFLTFVTSVTDGWMTINFQPMIKTDFALNGGFWGCPPHTETCTPGALTSSTTSTTLILSRLVTHFGVEIQPELAGAHDFTATFFMGGVPVGTVTRSGIVYGGAHLLAGSADAVFDRVVITGTTSFNIANIRYQAPNPTITLSQNSIITLFLRPVAGSGTPMSVPADMSYTPHFTASGTPKSEPARIAGSVEMIATTASSVNIRSLEVGNTGFAMLEYTASTPQSWMTLAPAEAAVAPGGSVQLDTYIDSETLPLGTNTGHINVTDPLATNPNQGVTVSAIVQEAPLLEFDNFLGPYSQSAGTSRYFIIEVPQGLSEMTVFIRPDQFGFGDADLYLRYGKIPSTTAYDCRPFTAESFEVCALDLPRAGTYYGMIRGATSYGDVLLGLLAGGVPIKPVITEVAAQTTSRLGIVWTDPSVNETRYVLQRRTLVDGTFGLWQPLATLPANMTYHADTTVVRGQTHRYRVRACNAAGCSEWSTTGNVTVPGPMIQMTTDALWFLFLRAADGTALTSASLTSQATALDATAETSSASVKIFAQYEGIEWTAATTHPWLAVTPTHGSLELNQFTPLGVTVDASSLAVGVHASEVLVTDPNAENSPKSLSVFADVRTVPALTNGVALTGQSGSTGSQTYYMVTVPDRAVRLTVQQSEAGTADLYVRHGGAPLLTKFDCRDSGTCTFDFPAGGNYYIMVHGVTSYTDGSLVATFGGSPVAPAGLTTTVLTSASVNLTWTDASSNETYFAAQKRTNVADVWSTWTNAGTPAANATSHTFTGLAGETIYQFRLRSCNTNGCSAWVAGAQVTTPPAVPPAVPTPVTATVISSTQMTVGWTDVAFETHYQVQRSTQVDGVFGAYVSLGSPTANTTTLADVVAPSSTYRYRVRACNTIGCSAFTLGPIVTTPAGEPPPTPTTLNAVAVSPTQINLSWSNVTGENGYQIYRRERVAGVFGPFTLIAAPPNDMTTFPDLGLTPGATYSHRIRACNTFGCSAFKLGPTVTMPGS
jgi:hypothetical protein